MNWLLLLVIPCWLSACIAPDQIPGTRELPPSGSPLPTVTPASTPENSHLLQPTETNLPQVPLPASPDPPPEIPVLNLPLAGVIASPQAEISGMAWHGDRLVILPQYPGKFGAGGVNGSLFSLEKADILAAIDSSGGTPLTPDLLPILNLEAVASLPGYEGFEAIAFHSDQVFLTVEANHKGTMSGYLIKGTVLPGEEGLILDPASLIEVPTPVQIFNAAYESLVITDGKPLMIFEANGQDLNPSPVALLVDNPESEMVFLDFAPIEFRITDATQLDSQGRFWVINLFMPIEFWYYTSQDALTEQFGEGATHAARFHVERLIELKYNQGQVTLSGKSPIQLELKPDEAANNWEALVRLDQIGFLTMTDTYPGTRLGFIRKP